MWHKNKKKCLELRKQETQLTLNNPRAHFTNNFLFLLKFEINIFSSCYGMWTNLIDAILNDFTTLEPNLQDQISNS